MVAVFQLDPEKDYVIPFECGCRVTFLGPGHEESELTPCREHSVIRRWRIRQRIQTEAEEELRLRRLVGREVPAGDIVLRRRKKAAVNVP